MFNSHNLTKKAPYNYKMKYPDINDDEFYDKIYNIYKEYTIPKK